MSAHEEDEFHDVSEDQRRTLRWLIGEAITFRGDPNEGVGLMSAIFDGEETSAIVIGERIEGGGWKCSVVAVMVTPELMERVRLPGTYTVVPGEPT